MTPEERLTKIENAIQALTEVQARHESGIEKQNAGIRDLIVVSRTLIDSQQETRADVAQLRESQNRAWEAIHALTAIVAALGVKVDKLSDSVDRFLRGLQKPNGSR